jgi:hypothetical protein
VSPIIEAPDRRSSGTHWRDRVITVALWLAWCYPVEAVGRLAAPDVTARIAGTIPAAAWLGDAFLSDLATAARVAGILVAGLLTWGSYGRWRAGPRSWYDGGAVTPRGGGGATGT